MFFIEQYKKYWWTYIIKLKKKILTWKSRFHFQKNIYVNAKIRQICPAKN